MRFPRPAALAAVVFLASICARPSEARAECDSAVPTCIDSDALWPTAGPTTFFSLAAAQTLAGKHFGFGLASAVQRDQIVLRTSAEGPAGSVSIPAIGTQLNTSFLFSYGVTDRLQVDVAAPVTFYQNGSGDSRAVGPPSEVPSSAVRDVRVGMAYALSALPRVRLPHGVGLVARFDLSIPSGDKDHFAGDRGFVGAPTIALEDRLGPVIFGANFGARLRARTELLGTGVASQGYLGVGLGIAIDRADRWAITSEAFALPALTSGTTSPYGWLAGVRWAGLWGGDLVVHAGGGGSFRGSARAELLEPTWRAVLDLRYEPLARDTDHDGVLDRDDQCLDEPEDRDGFEDTDGCPDLDNDHDGIADARDACRDVAEDVEGFEDQDGCPEPDLDADGIKDKVDVCPTKPEDIDGYEDKDGCPEGGKPKLASVACADGSSSAPGEKCDVDHDGVTDEVDSCPLAPEDRDGIVDEDGCAEKDADEDGVGDPVDRCPVVAENIDGVEDTDGCPEAGGRTLVTFDAGAIEVEKPVRFAFASANVAKAMTAQLAMIAQRLGGLVDRGVEKVVIEAWADTAGDDAAHQKLAQSRADAIAGALVKIGVPDALIKATPGDLGDPPDKTKANYVVTVRTKLKQPLSKLPPPPAQ